jgi:hypothetical protein
VASKEQYEFFRFLYEEEERRYAQLESRAKLYLSVVALFLASLAFKMEDAQKSVAILNVPWWLVLVEAVVLAAALVFILSGALIRNFEGVADPEDVIASFKDAPPTNEEFFDDRIADFAVATNRNTSTNDRAVRFLELAGVLLVIAMLVLLSVFTIALIQ